METIKFTSVCSCKAKSARSSNDSWLCLIKKIIPLALVDMVRFYANEARNASLAVYHLISNLRVAIN